MFKKKIATMALVGLMVFAGTTMTAFAAEAEGTENSGGTGQETNGSDFMAKWEKFIVSGRTIEGLNEVKANLEEKEITLEEAQANFESMLNEFALAGDMTLDEAKAKIAEIKESGKSLEGYSAMKAQLEEKGITLEEAQANFESMLNEFALAGDMTLDEAKAKIAEIKESGKSLEGYSAMKAQLEEKGITLDEAKSNFEGIFNEYAAERGVDANTAKDEVSSMKDSGKTLEGLKNVKTFAGNSSTTV